MIASGATLVRKGLLLAALAIVTGCAAGPPVQEMSDARQAISVARAAGASNCAPDSLRSAENHLDDALRNLTRKAYDEARVDAMEARDAAQAALASTEQSCPKESNS